MDRLEYAIMRLLQDRGHKVNSSQKFSLEEDMAYYTCGYGTCEFDYQVVRYLADSRVLEEDELLFTEAVAELMRYSEGYDVFMGTRRA